jgi:phosphatidylserine/phosphatidylglycerophosphate/cardiolipin synthase-like enzyme
MTAAGASEDWPLILAKVPNARILVATGDQKQHGKTFVIDGALTGVSTYNADWLSARVNSEEVALSWSKLFAADTLKRYEDLLADPEHGFVEYKIKRDEQGRALVKGGQPIVEYGPENHCPKDVLEKLDKERALLTYARDHLESLSPLRRPKLDPAKDPIHVVP